MLLFSAPSRSIFIASIPCICPIKIETHFCIFIYQFFAPLSIVALLYSFSKAVHSKTVHEFSPQARRPSRLTRGAARFVDFLCLEAVPQPVMHGTSSRRTCSSLASSSPRDVRLLLPCSRDVLPQLALGGTVRRSFWMGCREPGCNVLHHLGRLAQIWRACYWCLEACLLLV